jgi:hypothetical protein
MSENWKGKCYKNAVAPEDEKQNCRMWDFDNLSEDNVYIKSMHFREAINIVSPILVFGLLSSASKMHFFDNMRENFLGGASISIMRFFAPILVFKKSFAPNVNDKIYSMFGQDNIFQLAKDLNKMIDGICSIEFILNWLGSYCLPCEKEEKHSPTSGVSLESKHVTEKQTAADSVGMLSYVNQELGRVPNTMDYYAEKEECAGGKNCEESVITSKEMEVTGEAGGEL